MTQAIAAAALPLEPRKFRDPLVTVRGERRAHVALKALETLWVNTGTLCNLTCEKCYIESSPRNDRLAYLTAVGVTGYLDEIEELRLGTELIGFTGGEPFLNPDQPAMIEDALSRGFRAMVLTNAMRPIHKMKSALLGLRERFGDVWPCACRSTIMAASFMRSSEADAVGRRRSTGWSGSPRMGEPGQAVGHHTHRSDRRIARVNKPS